KFKLNFENPVNYNAKNFINNNFEKFKLDFELALKINLASSVTPLLKISRKRMAGHEIVVIKNPKSRSRTISDKKCILCVNDNPVDLKKKLEELGYSALLATTGQKAIDLLHSKFELFSISKVDSSVSEEDKLESFDISMRKNSYNGI
ncbi:679_t:CDS:2, partial [Gigaspora rosea]